MNSLKIHYFLCLLIVALFAGCKKDDMPDVGTVGDGFAFTANVNGEEFAVQSEAELTTQLTSIGLGQPLFFMAGVAILGNGAKAVGIGLQNIDFESLESEDEFRGDLVAGNFVIGTYQEINATTGEVEIEAISRENSAAKVTITGIDKEEQLISGEFEFTARDTSTNEEYKITDGIFSRIKYPN